MGIQCIQLNKRHCQGHHCSDTMLSTKRPSWRQCCGKQIRKGTAPPWPSLLHLSVHVAAVDLRTSHRPMDVTQQPTALRQPRISVRIASHSAWGHPMQDLKYHFLGTNQSVKIPDQISWHFHLPVMLLGRVTNGRFAIHHRIGIA